MSRRLCLAVAAAGVGAAACALYYSGWLRPPAAPVTGVQVVVLGEADPDVVAVLLPAVTRAYGVPCRLAPGSLPLPPAARDPRRGQYAASRLLPVVSALAATPGQRVLGVTNADLFEGDWNFVFGLSTLPGPGSVTSLARLRPRHGPPEAARAVLKERAAKIAIHELGHAAGLRHCPQENCVMCFACTAAGVDQTHADFCGRCRRHLRRP